MNSMLDKLTKEQREIITEYGVIHSRLSELEKQMESLKAEATELVAKLERLRNKDKKIFENYGKN